MARERQHFLCLALLVLLSASSASAFRFFPPWHTSKQAEARSSEFSGDIWALLIAGSNGFMNYRHQADVAHAYQVLKRGGVPDDHIVVMIYDDVAQDFQNPHPGKLFNRPGGPDVYADMPKDYVGENVNADTFLAVLQGKENAPVVLGSSGKTIKSGPKDRVFVYYSDHGAPGILGMPSGPFLYADKLAEALQNKSNSNGFAEMVIYIEACESGSMFEGMLDDSIKIYAVTAANAVESSWGAYCPGQDPPPPPEFGTCLGDLFSVSFLEDDDVENLTKETLEEQFELVKLRTSNNGTYQQGSHVLQFGSLSIDTEPVGDYVGLLNTGVENTNGVLRPARMGGLPQREADLAPLRYAVQRATTPQEKATAEAALQAELDRRADVDASVHLLVSGLLQQPQFALLFQVKYSGLLSANAAAAGMSEVELVVKGQLPRPNNAALVDDWDCLRAMVNAWEGACGRMDQYAMQYSRTFANLCNAGVPPVDVRSQAEGVCGPVVSVQ